MCGFPAQRLVANLSLHVRPYLEGGADTEAPLLFSFLFLFFRSKRQERERLKKSPEESGREHFPCFLSGLQIGYMTIPRRPNPKEQQSPSSKESSVLPVHLRNGPILGKKGTEGEPSLVHLRNEL